MKAIAHWISTAFALLAFAATSATAQTTDVKSLAEMMKQGGYVIVLRHGATDPKQGDVYPLDTKDMSKQRQLSDEGRKAAEQIGASISKLGIPIGDIYTSRLNRAVETGRLVSGKEGNAVDRLNDSSAGSASAMAGPSGGGNKMLGEALRKMADTPPKAGTNTLLVTHKTNITDAFGADLSNVAEGEAVIFKPSGSGKAAQIMRVKVGDWSSALPPR
jgi:broad specificity phosphatase PhoE